MSLTNEDLLAISQLLDVKLDSKLKSELQPLKDDIRDIKLHLENAKRYEKAVPEIQAMQADIDILKKVVTSHSEKTAKDFIKEDSQFVFKKVIIAAITGIQTVTFLSMPP